MGFYRNTLFPWGLDLIMSKKSFADLRSRALARAHGAVLEIGFGTGLNLPHYPSNAIDRLIVIDDNEGMSMKAQSRIEQSPIDIEFRMLSAEQLPVEDSSIDTVVSTWTLCSIRNVHSALLELKRIMKPEGVFLFCEHGLSPDARVAKWQHRLNPLQKIWACGCHLNRDMPALIRDAGFNISTLDEFYMKGEPRFAGYTFLGSAGSGG